MGGYLFTYFLVNSCDSLVTFSVINTVILSTPSFFCICLSPHYLKGPFFPSSLWGHWYPFSKLLLCSPPFVFLKSCPFLFRWSPATPLSIAPHILAMVAYSSVSVVPTGLVFMSEDMKLGASSERLHAALSSVSGLLHSIWSGRHIEMVHCHLWLRCRHLWAFILLFYPKHVRGIPALEIQCLSTATNARNRRMTSSVPGTFLLSERSILCCLLF